MKPPTGKLMATALRRCRDAEIAWEQSIDIDLADPKHPREMSGWGLRVNYEGRLGWAWGEVNETPESLLERATTAARSAPEEGILFAHGLPFSGTGAPPEPLDLKPHLDRLSQVVSRLQFMLPSLVPNRAVKLHAGLRWQMLSLVTRAGEQFGQRVVYHLDVCADDVPSLGTLVVASRLRSSPADLLCDMAWQAAHSDEVQDAPEGRMPALLTSAAAASLVTDLAATHFDAAGFASQPELAAPWGETWLSPKISLQDDGTLASGPGTVPFDGEGQSRRPVSLVHEGVVHHHLADRFQARLLGVDAPGLAVRDWGQPPRPGWSNLSLAPGASSLGEMARELGDGVILDRLIPTDAPREGDEFCRLAEVAFLLKGGRPTVRLGPTLVRGKFSELLGSGLVAVGSERSWHGRSLAPPLSLAAIELEKTYDAVELAETHGTWW